MDLNNCVVNTILRVVLTPIRLVLNLILPDPKEGIYAMGEEVKRLNQGPNWRKEN
jgi:hypothetical protein